MYVSNLKSQESVKNNNNKQTNKLDNGYKKREIIIWFVHRILEILTAGDRNLFLSGKELLSLIASMFPLVRLLSIVSLA